MPQHPASLLLPLAGAAAGALLGYFAFGWLAHQGLFAAALPGALLGAGYGMFVKHRSIPPAIACGFCALLLGIFSDWHILYKHYSLGHFLSHLNQIPTVELLLLILGGVFAFWFSLGKRQQVVPAVPPTAG